MTMTQDLRLEAVEIAHAIFARRVLSRLSGMLDQEELKQDLAAHVIGALKYYRPEKGSLRTFVGMTFDQWWKTSIRDRRSRAGLEESRWEMPDVPASASTGSEMTARSHRIISELPIQTREVAEFVIGYGVGAKAYSELSGVKYQTVNTRLKRARQVLRSMAD